MSSLKAEKVGHDLIETELKILGSQAAPKFATITDAQHRLRGYKRISDDDKTEIMLLELLKALPAKGQQNLIQDVVGRDDAGLRKLAKDIKNFLFT